MALQNRNRWAILYSALIFGTISCPYYYIATGALSYFRPKAIFIMVPWLALSTTLLFTISIARSKMEEKLAATLRRSYRLLFVAICVLAMSSSLFIESKIANYTLLLPAEYWYYLIVYSIAATTIALVIVILARPSRLELFIAEKLSRRERQHAAYRTIGYLALAFCLALVCTKLYQYYLYKSPPAP